MAFNDVKKTTLAEVYGGTSWTVDHANLRIVEALGKSRPAFHFGAIYDTLEAALERETFFEGAPSSEFRVEALPDYVRVPVRTPVPGGRFVEDDRPPSRAWVIVVGDLLSGGALTMEERLVAAVEFSFAPRNLADLCLLVPSTVVFEGEKASKVGVDYTRDGEIRADTNMVVEGVALPNTAVYFSRTEAVRAADALQARIVAAADWRSCSFVEGLQPTVVVELQAA